MLVKGGHAAGPAQKKRDPQFDRQFSKERYIVSNWDLAPVRYTACMIARVKRDAAKTDEQNNRIVDLLRLNSKSRGAAL